MKVYGIVDRHYNAWARETQYYTRFYLDKDQRDSYTKSDSVQFSFELDLEPEKLFPAEVQLGSPAVTIDESAT